jgi:hypothetical protein
MHHQPDDGLWRNMVYDELDQLHGLPSGNTKEDKHGRHGPRQKLEGLRVTHIGSATEAHCPMGEEGICDVVECRAIGRARVEANSTYKRTLANHHPEAHSLPLFLTATCT